MKPEDELKLYKEIVNNMTEGVCLVNAGDGKIVYTNPKFAQLFGYGLNEMAGQHISIVNAPGEKDPQQTAKEIMGELEKNGVWSGEVHNIKKDKTTFWCYANVSVFHHPTYGQVLVAVHQDITNRKEAEERAKKANLELEEKLAELTEFKQLTENREMKMIELKARIKELETQLAAKKSYG